MADEKKAEPNPLSQETQDALKEAFEDDSFSRHLRTGSPRGETAEQRKERERKDAEYIAEYNRKRGG